VKNNSRAEASDLVGLAPQGAGGQLGRVVQQDRPAVRRAEEIARPAPPTIPTRNLRWLIVVVPLVSLASRKPARIGFITNRPA